MKFVKKLTAVLLTAVMALTFLTACGGGGTSGVPGTDSKPKDFNYEELTNEINKNLSHSTLKYDEQFQKKLEDAVKQAANGQELSKENAAEIIQKIAETGAFNNCYPVAASLGDEASKDVEKVAAALVYQINDRNLEENYTLKDSPVAYFALKEPVGYTYYAVIQVGE